MSNFVVREGLLTEAWAWELGEWYQQFAPERDNLSYEAHVMVSRTYKSLTAKDRRHQRLPDGQFGVLRVLYQADGQRLPMSEIGRALNMSPANITKLIDALVIEGWVRRVTSSDDKRVTWAELTSEGAAAFREALPAALARVDDIWSVLTSEEKRVLVHLLAKVRLRVLTREAEAEAVEAVAQNAATVTV